MRLNSWTGIEGPPVSFLNCDRSGGRKLRKYKEVNNVWREMEFRGAKMAQMNNATRLNSRTGIEGPPSGLKVPELVIDAGCRDNRCNLVHVTTRL